TQAETTISALDQALALLSIGGLISLLLYRGHAGAETDAVLGWLDQLGPRYRIRSQDSPGPLLYLIERLR
ncbi:MAG: class I SAM-dependent methyltransferase, partial [Sedimenticolaceae bacterium]